MRRRLRAIVSLLALALVASGCQFLQNEFSFLDRAPPPPVVTSSVGP